MRHPHLIPLPSRERKSASSRPVINPLASVCGLALRVSVRLLTPRERRINKLGGGYLFLLGLPDVEIEDVFVRRDLRSRVHQRHLFPLDGIPALDGLIMDDYPRTRLQLFLQYRT